MKLYSRKRPRWLDQLHMDTRTMTRHIAINAINALGALGFGLLLYALLIAF